MKNSVAEYEILINKKGAGSGRFKAAYITDLHDIVWNNDSACLPRIIKNAGPDVIFCGGDMITAVPGRKNTDALDFMKRMTDIAPVYFGLGNHEFRSRLYPETYGDMYEKFMTPLLEKGMILLDNESRDISVNGAEITVYGLEIPRKNYARLENIPFTLEDMRPLLGRPKKQRAGILLAHNPVYHKTYEKWGADLILCGHYHGGIMRLGKHMGVISPGFELFTKYAAGHFESGGKHLVISAGLGEHSIPVRINNPRELVVLDIRINC